jgi:hypothetical protein
MLPEEANFVSDLRLRILANQNQGLPPEAGISKDDLKRAIDLCRRDYTAAQTKSKASGVTNPNAKPKGPPIDLAALFTQKKSS